MQQRREIDNWKELKANKVIRSTELSITQQLFEKEKKESEEADEKGIVWGDAEQYWLSQKFK